MVSFLFLDACTCYRVTVVVQKQKIKPFQNFYFFDFVCFKKKKPITLLVVLSYLTTRR